MMPEKEKASLANSAPDLGAPQRWTMLAALGGEVLEVADGYARGILPLSNAVMQPTRVFHAGAIATLADEVASAAIYGPIEETGLGAKPFPYSIQISINLLTNDPVGPLTAESKVIRRGRITVVDTEVRASNGDLASTMRSTHMMVNLKQSGPHNIVVK